MIKQVQSKSCNTICIKTFSSSLQGTETATSPSSLHSTSECSKGSFLPLIWTQTHPVYAGTQMGWQELEAGQNEINLEVWNLALSFSPSRPHGHFWWSVAIADLGLSGEKILEIRFRSFNKWCPSAVSLSFYLFCFSCFSLFPINFLFIYHLIKLHTSEIEA